MEWDAYDGAQANEKGSLKIVHEAESTYAFRGSKAAAAAAAAAAVPSTVDIF